jgi:hypothetical protein
MSQEVSMSARWYIETRTPDGEWYRHHDTSEEIAEADFERVSTIGRVDVRLRRQIGDGTPTTVAEAAHLTRSGARTAVDRGGPQRDAAEPLQTVADPLAAKLETVAAELEAVLEMSRSGADHKALRRALRRIEELLDE